jgi:transcriptional regulator with XRE-family HTH domain
MINVGNIDDLRRGVFDLLIDTTLTLGQRFKYYREQKGLSQNSLAKGICSYSTISHLENDRSIPSPKLMGKLADKLGVPLREIMGMQEIQLDAGFQIEMVHVYSERADYNQALQLIDELERREDLLDHERIELIVCRAHCQVKTGKHEQTVELLRPFLEQQQVQQTIDDELLCDTFNKLGYAFFKMRDFKRAYSAYESGYRISLKLPDFGLVAARVTKNLGLVCNQLNLFDDAQRYLEKAQTFYGAVSDVKGLADTIFALGIATNNESHLTKSKLLYESLNLVEEANIVKQHYAYSVESKVDYKSSIKTFRSAVAEFEKLGVHYRSLFTLSQAALIALKNDDSEEAVRLLDQAEELRNSRKEEVVFALRIFYKAYAKLKFIQNQYDDCKKYSEISSELYAKMGMYDESAEALQICAEAYQIEGDYQNACMVFGKVSELLWKSLRGRN